MTERNSEHKIAIAVLVVLGCKVLGIDAESIRVMLTNAQAIDEQVRVSTGINASELGMVAVAVVYNWGRVVIKKARDIMGGQP